jgi:hypothetical protein
MPDYLFTARTSEGRAVTDRITAPTVNAARYALETRRYEDIVFHTDDQTARLDAQMARDLDPDQEGEVLTPEQQLEARRGGGFLHGLWFAWKVNSIFWLPILIWCAISFVGSRPFGLGDWAGFILAGLFMVYFVVLVIPGVAYQASLRAAVWNRLGETRFWTAVLRRMPLVSGGAFPKLDLDVRLASVLARHGRVDEGRRLLEPYLAGTPDAMTVARIAGFHNAAGEYAMAHELSCRAVALSNGGIIETIDQALGLVRYLRRPAEARACLERIADQELLEAPRIYVAYIEGLIALEEKRYTEAVTALEKTVTLMQPMASSELIKGLLRDIWAFQSIALAGVGRMTEARALLARARPMLEARRETELLQRCRAAVGR